MIKYLQGLADQPSNPSSSFNVALLTDDGEQALAAAWAERPAPAASGSASAAAGADAAVDDGVDAGEVSAGADATDEMNRRKVRTAGESNWTMMKKIDLGIF